MTRSETKYVSCPCDMCNGETIKQSLATKHRKDAELVGRKTARLERAKASAIEPKSDDTVDGLIGDVFRMTLQGQTSNTHWKQGDAIWERTSREPLVSEGCSPTAYTFSTPPASSISDCKPAVPEPQTSSKCRSRLYDELVSLDYQLESHIANVGQILAMDTPAHSAGSLKDHELWLRNTLQRLQTTKAGDDIATKTLLGAMLQRTEHHILQIETRSKTLAEMVRAKQTEGFDTGA